MFKKLKVSIKDQEFLPSLLGIIINPFYIIRRGIYLGLKQNKRYISGKLLDFGAGSMPYKSIFTVKDYVGLDIGESGYHDVKSAEVFYDGKTIPFNDDHFDSILCSEVFEHVFNLDEVLVELNRVLKVDGHILITIPFVWPEHEVPFDFARYSTFGIKHLLEKTGFEVVEMDKTNDYIQTVFQLWIAYLFNYVFPSNIIVKYTLHLLVTFPLTLCGLLLSKILPKTKNLYCNIVIVGKKLKVGE